MENPLDRIARLTPVAVLADRSRDATEWPVLGEIEPYHAFRVTDNRRRLTRRILEAHDVVVIFGSGTVPYSKSERAALVEFVERGGSLVLAASAGTFEAGTGLPVSRMAIDGVARAFGFRYLSAAAYPVRHENHRHARRQDLELTAAGARVGLDRDDTRLLYPAPIEAPRGATVLLREKRTGAPVIARIRAGRGTVAVYGDAFLWTNGWSSFGAIVHLAALAPRRRTTAKRPPLRLDVPREEISEGRIRIRFSPFAKGSATRVLGLAKAVLDHLRREVRPPSVPDRLVIHLEPGCSMRGVLGGKKELSLVLGADLRDGTVVESLGRMLTFRFLHRWWGFRRSSPFVHAAQRLLKVRAMEALGLGDDAAAWLDSMRGGKPVDAGTFYSESIRPPRAMARFFLDLEERFGRGAFRRMCRVIPKKKPFEGFPDLFSALDRFAFFLARALGREVYDWIEENGHTVRRLPLEEPGSDAFRAGIDRTLRRLLEDPAEPFSARLGAARTLADRVKDEKGLLARARGRTSGRGLPAAIALARTRDDRGREILERWTRSPDDGIAAVAALFALTEYGPRRRTADRLVGLADGGDTAFRLAVGRALGAVDDPRAERFSFESLPGCRVRLWRNGNLRAYASVDGRDVAVVLVGPMFWAQGFGRATSRCYVFWVHTHGPFRRLGIARHLFDAALEASPWSEVCTEVALHSMRDYFAHALYRDRGMIDTRESVSLTKDVLPTTRRAPKGVRIRMATPDDALAAADLARRVHEVRAQPNVRFPRFPEGRLACVAEEGRTLRGVVVFVGARLFSFAVDETIEDAARRERIALALLAFAERRQAEQGEKTLSGSTQWRYDDPTHVRWLQRAGFSSKPDPLVEQARITDLARYLVEIEGVLEARLAAAKSPARRVTVGIDGGEPRLRATLRIDGARVRATAGRPGTAGLVLRSHPDAIQSVVFGMTSPFEELNQRRLDVLPTPNGETRKLLEVLFPSPAG